MKQIICLVLGLILCLGCTACTSGVETLYTEETVGGEKSAASAVPEAEITEALTQDEQKLAWGITLTAKDVTPTGLTLLCTQSGGEPTGELQTGSYYFIEKKENDVWVKVEYTEIEEDKVGWTAEAWIIPPESELEWKVDWSWLHGELPAGEYRIGKSFMDWRAPGDYDEAGIYAEFCIE